MAREPNRARQQTGIVFQARSLDLKLTVAENLKIRATCMGGAGQRSRRAAKKCCAGGLERPGEGLCGNSLGGMQRRVELAKGLIYSPAALRLDEPSTGLYPARAVYVGIPANIA